MLANVIERFREIRDWNSKKEFCRENFLSISTLNQLEKMKNQFCEILKEARFVNILCINLLYDCY